MRIVKYILVFMTLAAWLLPTDALCQVTINALHLQRDMCAGSRQTVSFGARNVNTVVVRQQEASLGHSDRIFLPDGERCDGSCSYRSAVTFDIFDDDAVITSAQDIKFVRINLEHSYIGDIYINITCPDGKKSDIMRFAGSGTSACDSVIPQQSRRWLSGDNLNEGTFFGQANDDQNSSYPCNPAASGNEPGIGWNYCWSSNTTSGFQYASGDGIVYRSGHGHNGRVDSSDVAGHRNFYHPDESFAHLVGCPLNGTWYIEVVDGFSVDNGYIFEWELRLDAALLPNNCKPAEYGVEGGVLERVSDSVFTLVAPAAVAADSAVEYRFWVVTTCGDTVDTTATVVFHPNTESWVDDTVCQGDEYFVGPYPVDSSGTVVIISASGCDSTVHLNLTVHPSYDILIVDSTCKNIPYPFEGSMYSTDGIHPHLLRTIHDCDSLRSLKLTVLSRNLRAEIYASPLVMDENHQEITLKDFSVNHVDSRWMIAGDIFHESEMTLPYPADLDSLEISLEAVSREGCYDTATVVAHYDRSRMFLPNVFTPSLNSNDLWHPVTQDVTEMEIWIYNRQGLLVAHLEGIDAAWDGGDWPQGTYVYTIHYRTRVHPEWKQEVTGSVVMIR